jgi:hypothetical protein
VLAARVEIEEPEKCSSSLFLTLSKSHSLLTSGREGESIAVLRVLCLEVLGGHLSSSVGECPQLVLCVVDLRGEKE